MSEPKTTENQTLVTYKVTANTGVTVLKKTSLAIKDLEKTLKENQKLEEIFPSAWIQGEWTNVIVTTGVVVDTNDYEKTRLEVLASIGAIEKIK